jgi:hypothetical protein
MRSRAARYQQRCETGQANRRSDGNTASIVLVGAMRIADQAIERVAAKVMLRSRRDKPVKGL